MAAPTATVASAREGLAVGRLLSLEDRLRCWWQVALVDRLAVTTTRLQWEATAAECPARREAPRYEQRRCRLSRHYFIIVCSVHAIFSDSALSPVQGCNDDIPGGRGGTQREAGTGGLGNRGYNPGSDGSGHDGGHGGGTDTLMSTTVSFTFEAPPLHRLATCILNARAHDISREAGASALVGPDGPCMATVAAVAAAEAGLAAGVAAEVATAWAEAEALGT